MIVSRDGDRFVLVTQPDHARLAGDVLALWRADGFPEHPRRAELLLAVREHDNGWREDDAAPRVDSADGLPLDFRRYPAEARFELWRRAVARLAERPWVAALVAHHAIEIYRQRTSAPWEEFRRAIAARRDELLAASEHNAEDLAGDYCWLELCDTLSLVACGGLDGPLTCRGHRLSRQGAALVIDPFPLAGATTFQVALRRIPARRYPDSVALATELARARWRREPLRLIPPPP